MNVYPIIIPTLCRFEKFKDCIESLSRCNLAKQTELIIGLDYPLNNSHEEGYKKIKEYVRDINGFKNVIILYTNKNLGISENVKRLREYVADKYDAFIFTEDDNVFSPNFLEYMNYNLEKYKEDKEVYAICGYNYLLPWKRNFSRDYVYKSFFYSPWGVGLWFEKFVPVSISETDTVLSNYQMVCKMALHTPYLLITLVNMRYYNKIFGDAIIRMRLFIEKKNCIFPTISKVRNCGYDNNDLNINCKYDGGVHINQQIDQNNTYQDNGCIDIPNLMQLLKKYYKVSFISKTKTLVKYLLLLFRNKDVYKG